jgi:hypothetical protein
MSRSGTPTDNLIIESMIGWIEAQIKCDYKIGEWDSVDEFIHQYVKYYNYHWPSSKLQYKTLLNILLNKAFNVL